MLGFWIIVTHLVGAYLTTSQYISGRAPSSSTFAGIASVLYIVPFIIFLPITPLSLLVILAFRFIVMRFSLVDYIVWARNMLAPRTNRTERVVKEGVLEMDKASANQIVSIHGGSLAIHSVVIALAIIVL